MQEQQTWHKRNWQGKLAVRSHEQVSLLDKVLFDKFPIAVLQVSKWDLLRKNSINFVVHTKM